MRLMAGSRIFWRGDLCPVFWESLYATTRGRRLTYMSDLSLAHMS